MRLATDSGGQRAAMPSAHQSVAMKRSTDEIHTAAPATGVGFEASEEEHDIKGSPHPLIAGPSNASLVNRGRAGPYSQEVSDVNRLSKTRKQHQSDGVFVFSPEDDRLNNS